MATGLEPTAKGQSKGWRRLITEQVGSYELCLSFTRNGLARRVPWVFVLYATGAEKGTRMRAIDASEVVNRKITHVTNHTFRFLAREEAYVDNYSCHGRVILLRGMSKEQRDDAQAKIEATELSAIVDGKRDCQKWCTEYLSALDFPAEFVKFWEGLLGVNVYEIETAVGDLQGKWGLGFLKGLAYQMKHDAEMELLMEDMRKAYKEGMNEFARLEREASGNFKN